MKNDSIKSVIVLTAICLVIALLMAFVNSVTAPIIEENDAKAAQAALQIVLPDATGFDELSGDFPASVRNAYVDKGGSGYAFILEAKGFGSSPIRIAVGIGNDGKIIKVNTIDCSSESKGYGSQVAESWFTSRFDGADADTVSGVDIISGATISSSAYRNAIKDALTAFASVSD
ncbi:MAG: FMN-binding protein [Clostridia bacterium]|nr:FMN-binding protein [Clostridia bacterium]